jgi:hypothetical protein
MADQLDLMAQGDRRDRLQRLAMRLALLAAGLVLLSFLGGTLGQAIEIKLFGRSPDAVMGRMGVVALYLFMAAEIAALAAGVTFVVSLFTKRVIQEGNRSPSTPIR